MIERSLYYLAIGDNDQADGYGRLAEEVWQTYTKGVDFKTMRGNEKIRVDSVDLDPIPVIRRRVLDQVLDPKNGFLDDFLAAQLRTALSMPAVPLRPPEPAPDAGCTTPAAPASNNAPSPTPTQPPKP